MRQTYYFMAGMPRSGSTVLASILNQNPAVYVTPTSPLLDLLYLNEQAWRSAPSVISNPIPSQVEAISQGIIRGCWAHVPQNIIIDKHRAWAKNLKTIEYIFNQPPKVIMTVRDVPSILASFMTLLRKTSQNPHYIDQILLQKRLPLTDENRVDVLWRDFVKEGYDYIGIACASNRRALHIVNYDDLIENKQETIAKIYDFLELPPCTHDFDNIESKTADDDLLAWGLEGLHTIKPKLEKVAKTPQEILGDKIFDKYKHIKIHY